MAKKAAAWFIMVALFGLLVAASAETTGSILSGLGVVLGAIIITFAIAWAVYTLVPQEKKDG